MTRLELAASTTPNWKNLEIFPVIVDYFMLAYTVSIEYHKSVVGVILEAAVGCRGYVTRCIVVEGLGRYHQVVAEFLDRSRSYSAEIIISITHFGRICKH